MADMGKLLILAGVFLIAGGLLFLLVGKIPGLGKLPGDILIKKEHVTFYFPLATCIMISVIISLILFLFKRP